jgi:hypothetical protein
VGSILFVHGTGVREPSFSVTLETIKTKIERHLPGTAINGCYWGDAGAKLNLDGASIPDYASSRTDTIDSELALWHLLDEDPLFELRLLADTTTPLEEIPPGSASQGSKLGIHLDAFTFEPEFRRQLGAFGYDNIWWQAFLDVRDEDVCHRAIENSYEAGGRVEYCIARAVAALGAIYANEIGLPALTAQQRDMLIAALLTNLRPTQHRGVIAWGTSALSNLALRIVTRRLIDRKRSLMNISSSGGGDILLYQGRGQHIRSVVRAAVRAQTEPVVLLAHSLGGVVCVDILWQDPTLPVRKLITVGSQSPYFYEIGALQGGSLEMALPSDFPPWLNIYDQNDLLSFVGSDIFGDRIVDYRVGSGQPFPYAHSAYWNNDDVWTSIADFCRR